ncbi:BnaA05g15390D [Brassica napus]|uniref:BnaA05g15390D protein n=1 Tax=Brassica napus TaxID=3708 RepID=A0A078I2W8_BRANA|nr:BnaA05g15390D [Brassica napus]
MSKAPSVFRSHTTRKGFVLLNDGERYCTELLMQAHKKKIKLTLC